MDYIKYELYLHQIKKHLVGKKRAKSSVKPEELYTYNQLMKFRDYLKSKEKE